MGKRYNDSFEQPDKKKDVEEEPWWNKSRPQAQEQPQMQGAPASAGVPGGYYNDLDDEGMSLGKLAAIVIAVVAAVLIIGCGAAFALSHQGEAQDEEPSITQEDEEAAKQASMVYLTVYADGASEETSSCGIKIYKGDSGEDVAKAVDLKCNERGDVGILDIGTYRVHVDTVPSNADGSTYLAPLFDMSFEVAGDGQDMELTLNLDAANVDGTQTDGDQVVADGQAVVDGNTGASDAGAGSSDASAGGTNTQSGSGGSVQSHQHNWVAQTTTKHHDAVYRTVNHAAVKERRTICDSCNQDITGSYSQHKAASGHSSYHYEYKVTKEAYSEKVLVSAAYDETSTTGYKCSTCGATK